MPKFCTWMPGACGGAPGRPGGLNCGVCGVGIPGTGGGIGFTSAVFFTWSSTIVCPAAGLEITEVLPESTRVFPSLARENR
ncbi:MAG: hypothetical protein WA015_23265 [Bryobacteraceae bacterium]